MLLLKGDCLERLKELPKNSVDCVICDLPYGTTACEWDNPIDLDRLWVELKRVGKHGTPYFFFTTTKYGVDLILSNRKWFRYDLVWLKGRITNPLTSYSKMGTAHEMLYMFAKPTRKVCYNLKKYHKKVVLDKTFKANNTLMNTNITHKRTKYYPPLPKSYFTYSKETGKKKKGEHPSSKPAELIKYILRYYTNEGDVVLDPTMGGGSIGRACLEIGRDFIGIEINEEIYNKAENMLLGINDKRETTGGDSGIHDKEGGEEEGDNGRAEEGEE